MLTTLMHDWLGLLLDVVLIVGVLVLWLTWQRNAKRQQKLEQLLMGTAQQLEEASMHLSLAMSAIEKLEKKQQEPPTPPPELVKKAPQEKAPAATFSMAELDAPKLPPQGSTQASMILRMQREGESEQSIAERLDIPLAQVKLMLKLHAASRAAS